MAAVVVDTNVISFEFKSDSRAYLYHPHLVGKFLVMSFMALAELDLWALERQWGHKRKAKMEDQIRRYVIYPFNRGLCLKWAEATNSARRNGHPIQTADAWMAATALALAIPLVTHNPSDYEGVDNLTVISEAKQP
jgi:tRNA(fMet)-specific endonuclease VapC